MLEKKTFYIETYGCQMNVSDSQVVVAILEDSGMNRITNPEKADVVLLNTCSIRENAEQRVWGRLRSLRGKKYGNPVIGVIGCMAERVGDAFVDKGLARIVAGPDAYRNLPVMLAEAFQGGTQVDTMLTTHETYAGICPDHLADSHVSAFVSITRGCDNFCSYCIVPYTRGRERSRPVKSILEEAARMIENGVKEITLLGQNVNSYQFGDGNSLTDFPHLLGQVAMLDTNVRIRFTTSHPKDMSDQILETIARHRNICNHIHLPLQSGSNRILQLMNRRYTREWYMGRIEAIRSIIPGCGITTDVFAGFSSETEDDHKMTLDLMEKAAFDFSFMFKYSERPGTIAAKTMPDNVPEEVKLRRLSEIITLQNRLSAESNRRDVGKTVEVLAETISKKSENELAGRNQQNKSIVFVKQYFRPGDYVNVKVKSFTQATLKGEPV